MGTDIMTSLDRAIEIYIKVVENAPYGNLAEKAQFSLGEALKKSERYDEAIMAYQKLIDDYPTSKLVDSAKYQVAYCAYKASLKPPYDSAPTERAIEAFEEFASANTNEELSKEADKTIQRLKDKAAEKSLLTARFYERQKRYQGAIIYYQEVVDKYPESSFVGEAKTKVEELKKKVAHESSKLKAQSSKL
jgi:outer membrane protein assembly factor BamD